MPGAASPPRRAASRVGKRDILIHIEPEMVRRLKQLALDRDTILQAIGVEAFELFLQRTEQCRLGMSIHPGRPR